MGLLLEVRRVLGTSAADSESTRSELPSNPLARVVLRIRNVHTELTRCWQTRLDDSRGER